VEVYFMLFLCGLAIGILGTLIGAGGGFILVPLLLVLYPKESPEIITSISLAVTCLNAFSGTIAYAKLKRIHYKYGCIFTVASIPGAVLGAISTNYISRSIFDFMFGILLLSISVFVFFRNPAPHLDEENKKIDEIHLSAKQLRLGILLSVGISFIASFVGIGGGIIHVPALSTFLGFPIHFATATSHFVLAITSLMGTIVHIIGGSFHRGMRRTIAIGFGVVIGAQIGALLSSKIKGQTILKALAFALFLVGMRLIVFAFIKAN